MQSMAVKINPPPFVEPNEIIFIGPVTSDVKKLINLSNTTNNKLLFKMKSKTPELYNVKPNLGLIEPKNSKKITITALAQKKGPACHVDCWLLIEYTYVKASKTISDPKAELVLCQNTIENLKVRCTFTDEDRIHKEQIITEAHNTGKKLDDVQWDFQHRYEALCTEMIGLTEECNRLKEANKQLNQDKSDLVDNIKTMEAVVNEHKVRITALEEENRVLKQKELDLIHQLKEERDQTRSSKQPETFGFDQRETSTDTLEIKFTENAEMEQGGSSSEFLFDPNLACSKCHKQFRSNELRLAKIHLQQCQSDEHD